jgi:hypothetical protein
MAHMDEDRAELETLLRAYNVACRKFQVVSSALAASIAADLTPSLALLSEEEQARETVTSARSLLLIAYQKRIGRLHTKSDADEYA